MHTQIQLKRVYCVISSRFLPNFVIFRGHDKISILTINLTRARLIRINSISYFTVIQTKTYTCCVSTLPKSISDKIVSKKALISLDVSAIQSLTETCNVCPLAIPEEVKLPFSKFCLKSSKHQHDLMTS